jgi:hypothetical protein
LLPQKLLLIQNTGETMMAFYNINPYHVLTAINSGGDQPITFGAFSIITPSISHKTK